jgi:hypothetical protein
MCILKYGSILDIPRNCLCKRQWFEDLFKCSLCLGFWTGVFTGIIGGIIESDLRFFMMPIVSAGICWTGDSILRVVHTLELFLDKKLEK